jgi:phospholipid/cholesterol/gamma-HCH transport system substrate-binding protein
LELMSPGMVGALTVLIAIVAVFLSYNAGSSLPFVPTYNIAVQVPDAQELVPNNEVLVGGRRVGVISAIEPRLTAEGHPYAQLDLKLGVDMDGQIHTDGTARVRARSLLGAKYLELTTGSAGPSLAPGHVLPLAQARTEVEVDELVDELDGRTRRNLADVLGGLGTGLAGRGLDTNASLASLRPLVRDTKTAFGELAAPQTQLPRLIRAFAATAAELGISPQDLSGILTNGSDTLAALEAAGPQLARSIRQSPGTLRAGTESFAVLTPVIAHARKITARLAPVAPLLPATAKRLELAARAAAPTLRRARVLPPLLNDTFGQLEGLAADEPTVPALNSLAGVLPGLRSDVEYLTPYQTVCNYIALAGRNTASAPSEGNAGGNWLRFSAIIQPSEMFPRAAPAPRLHFDPYPNGAAPGQPHECEAGNQPYLPGRVIGNVPGNQGTKTELTTPEQTAAVTK